MNSPLKEIGSHLSKLQLLLQEAKKDQLRISNLLNGLTTTLENLWGEEAIKSILLSRADSPTAVKTSTTTNTADHPNETKSRSRVGLRDQWDELVTLLASGRVLGVAGQAEAALSSTRPSRPTEGIVLQNDSGESQGDETAIPKEHKSRWIAAGPQYALWIGKGIARLNIDLVENKSGSEESVTKLRMALAQLCGRALSLGYSDDIVRSMTMELVIDRSGGGVPVTKSYESFIACLTPPERRHFIQALLRVLEKNYRLETPRTFPPSGSAPAKGWKSVSDLQRDRLIPGIAALIQPLLRNIPAVSETLKDALTSSPPAFDLVRAVMAALSVPDTQAVLDRALAQFGDNLYIRHTPILHQEALTRVLLLCSGYYHRSSPDRCRDLLRSGRHSAAVSNRLASTSSRSRFLGMVFGEATSVLIDRPDVRLKFDVEEMKTEEAKWYRSLVNIVDDIGSIEVLKVSKLVSQVPAKLDSSAVKAPKKEALIPSRPKIIEVLDDSDVEDDLVPYQKPHSDHEDEEDATLVDRNKPKAPAYIRDLIAALQDADSHERFNLALSTASSLIRRKADFGSELRDLSEELAGVLAGLQDRYEDGDDWYDRRQEAMISLVVAQPKIIGPYYARSFFSGDYSVNQRTSMITALGLGARELSGLKRADKPVEKAFPTKRLPIHLHQMFAEPVESKEINAITDKLEQHFLRPVTTTGRPKRKKMLQNDLISIVADFFFFPLTGYWDTQSRMGSARHISLSPVLLPVFLKTLAIILDAAGPAVVTLQQMTGEFWQLLLAIRARAFDDTPMLEGLLFSFLALLNVNEDKGHVATEWGRELLETQEWVSNVFDKLSNAVDEEGERCKVLSATILLRIKSVVEKHQQKLLGVYTPL